MVTHIDTVGIHLELGAGRAILQVVLAAMLGHKGALGKRLERHLVVIVHPEAFPAMAVGMQPHEVVNLADGGKIVSADFNALEGIFVARAIVFVESSVIIEEDVGVPGGQCVAFHRTAPAAALGVGGIPDGQALVGRTRVKQRVTHYPCGGSALVVIGGIALERGLTEVPVTQVAGIVETALVGREQVVLALVGQRHGVGTRAERATLAGVVVPGLVVVTDVERIAIGAGSSVAGIIPTRGLGFTAWSGKAAAGLDRQRDVYLPLSSSPRDYSHFLAWIMDAQQAVMVGARERITALGIGVAMSRAIEPHHGGPL